jgi:hypothetical protein
VVSLQPNLHLREQVERLAPCPDPSAASRCCCCRAGGQTWGGDAPGEEQALDYLLANAACWACVNR